jgi:hypothetical protein
MAYLRTPTWRDKAKSLAEQVEVAWGTERLRYRDVASLREALQGTEWEAVRDQELEAMRDELVADLESGHVGLEMPVNNLIKLFLQSSTRLGWLVFALDWNRAARGRPRTHSRRHARLGARSDTALSG